MIELVFGNKLHLISKKFRLYSYVTKYRIFKTCLESAKPNFACGWLVFLEKHYLKKRCLENGSDQGALERTGSDYVESRKAI